MIEVEPPTCSKERSGKLMEQGACRGRKTFGRPIYKKEHVMKIPKLLIFSAMALSLAVVPNLQEARAGDAKPAAPVASADIVDTAVAAGNFKTLATALQAAGLIDTLKGPGPFTVFAPTDEAFAKLPAGALEGLLKDKAKLSAVLTYHVVPGMVTASEVVKLKEAKTVNGQAAKITVQGSEVMVDGAKVVKTDIKTKNGVIHVIDAVIMPKS